MLTAEQLRGFDVFNKNKLPLTPFNHSGYFITNLQDLQDLKAYLLIAVEIPVTGWEVFDNPDLNLQLIELFTAAGRPGVSIVYAPMAARYRAGIATAYVQRRLLGLLTKVAFNAAREAGYGLDAGTHMFNHLLANMQADTMIKIAAMHNTENALTSSEAIRLDRELTGDQWHFVNRLSPTCLASIACDQFMLMDHTVVEVYDDDTWAATTYFHSK